MITDQPEEKDPLDALLREQTTYIEDRGFTDRVIQSLPRRKRELLRPIVLLCASAIGIALASRWLPWGALEPVNAYNLVSNDPQNISPWLLIGTVLSSLAWTVVNALNGDVDLF